MVNSRAKGAYGEREFAQAADGIKISRSGYTGPDVWIEPGLLVEVKRRKQGASIIYEALQQAKGSGAHLAAFRRDRAPWIMSMYLDDFRDLYVPMGVELIPRPQEVVDLGR